METDQGIELGGGLGWWTASKIAWRDVRASWVKFIFVIVAVALGVGSLTGTRSFSLDFQQTLLDQARTILAADLSARSYHPYTAAEMERLNPLKADGVRFTLVTDTVSMASVATDPNPLLVSLKAVDPSQYPYYGAVKLASGRPLHTVLTGNRAVVSQEFLLRMHAHLGDTLHLGNSEFQIADILQSEPDRISSNFGIGPRVMIPQAALPATGLVRAGSRAAERLLFQLPKPGEGKPAMTIGTLRQKVGKILPQAQITDFREANPALVKGLKRSTSMLTLISLVTMVLSAIGVGMAMHAHLRQRLETIAIMKTLGARSSQIIRIYGLQTLFLGIAGAVLGIAAGSAVARAFPVLLRRIIILPLEGHLRAEPVLIGLATGVLTTLLFTLPPLLEIRGFPPLRILRRHVEQNEGPSGWRPFLRDRAQIVAMGAILAGLAAIASTLTGSATVGGWFAGGLFALLVFLLFAASGMLFSVRWLLGRWRSRFSPAARQGLANLFRPGNQSGALLTALSVGVMLIMTVYFVERSVVREMVEAGSANSPNVFLIDISPDELPGIKKLIASQPAVQGALETIPVVSAQILSIDGVSSDQLHDPHVPKHMLHSTSLTWADSLPIGETVVHGHWWGQGSQMPATVPLAVDTDTTKLLHLKVGSRIDFRAGRQRIAATVAALVKGDGQHIYSRSRFILPSGVLAGQEVIWYAGFHTPPTRVAEVERAVFAAYPTVTLVNLADVMQAIQRAVDRIAAILRFLAGFAMIAGCIILASSVAATRFQRMRETAILKSLGALRSQLVSILGVEFLTLGGFAGIAGTVFALILASILLGKMKTSFHPSWMAPVAAILATAILAAVIGWLASLRILRQKPLEVLREE